MSQYDLLVQALQEQQMLSQAQAGHEGVMSRFRPIEQKYEDVNTSRFKRGLMGAGEAIVDAIRRPGAQKQYYSGLEEALSSARGVDEIKAQIEMMAQVRAAEEQRAYEEQKALAKHQRALEMQSKKDEAAMSRAQLPKPGPTVNVYGEPKPTPFQEATDKKAAEMYSGMQVAIESIPKLETHLSKMEEISKGMKTGRIADVNAAIGEWLGTDAGTSRQVWNSQAVPQLLELAKAVKGPMTEREWAMLERALPQFGFSNEANEQVISLIRAGMQRQQDNFRSATAYQNQRGHLRGWEPPYSVGGSETTAPQQQPAGSESEYQKWLQQTGRANNGN